MAHGLEQPRPHASRDARWKNSGAHKACEEFSDALGSANAALQVKAAFLWLQANNPYYANVEWREDAAAAWTVEDVQVGATREADDDVWHVPPATPAVATLSEALSDFSAQHTGWSLQRSG